MLSQKRPSSVHEYPANKKLKGVLKNANQQKPQTQQNLPIDFFDKAPLQRNIASDSTVKSATKVSKNDRLTEDTQNVKVEVKKIEENDADQPSTSHQLPEGFFDDPIMDAKVRNVEYKDPIEEEYEKFQREIKEEIAQSAQITTDDEEETATSRQIHENYEQMFHWSRVLDLIKRKEQMDLAKTKNKSEQQGTEGKQASEDEGTSSENEEEFDEFIDWRSKSSYKKLPDQ